MRRVKPVYLLQGNLAAVHTVNCVRVYRSRFNRLLNRPHQRLGRSSTVLLQPTRIGQR